MSSFKKRLAIGFLEQSLPQEAALTLGIETIIKLIIHAVMLGILGASFIVAFILGIYVTLMHYGIPFEYTILSVLGTFILLISISYYIVKKSLKRLLLLKKEMAFFPPSQGANATGQIKNMIAGFMAGLHKKTM